MPPETQTITGPMEAWAEKSAMHVTEQAGLLSWWVPWGSCVEKAREHDVVRRELEAALERYVDCDGYDDEIKAQARAALERAKAAR